MNYSEEPRRGEELLAAILSEESFRPFEPNELRDTGLPESLIESLIVKRLSLVGMSTGRKLAEFVCLPFQIVGQILHTLRERRTVVHKGSAPLNDYTYALTEDGRDRAQVYTNACSYVGPAPVPLLDYVLSAEAQTIRAESPRRQQLQQAFSDITVDARLFESLGPAINSGAGLFLYGEPGNGKSTLAKRITMCFGQQIWIPSAIYEDGQIIKLYDAAFHKLSEDGEQSILKSASYDRRWVKIQRPTVVVGGELTMDSLEIRHDPHSNVSEAPLQMKSNCGCLLVDDFGRQRIDASELLNRWIIPLEARVDFLTLSTGKKIQVPFEQLIIFSTNLEPNDLADEAFLRRIPYKIEIGNPSPEEFHRLFELCAPAYDCDYVPGAIDYLLKTHYQQRGRPLRRCHPRDLLSQIRNYCVYNDLPIEMRDEYFDKVVKSYFTMIQKPQPTAQRPRRSPNGARPATPQQKSKAAPQRAPRKSAPAVTQRSGPIPAGPQPNVDGKGNSSGAVPTPTPAG